MPPKTVLLSDLISTIGKASTQIAAEIAVLEAYQATPELEPPRIHVSLEKTIEKNRMALSEVTNEINLLKIEFFDAFSTGGDSEELENLQKRVSDLSHYRMKLETDLKEKQRSFNRYSPEVLMQMTAGVLHAQEDAQRRKVIRDRVAMLIEEQRALDTVRAEIVSLKQHSTSSSDFSADTGHFLERLMSVARGHYFNSDHPFRKNVTDHDLNEVAASASSLLAEAAIQLGGHATTPKYPSMAKSCLDITAHFVAVAKPKGDHCKDWKTRDQVLLETRNFKQAAVHSAYWSAFAASQALLPNSLQTDVSENTLTATMLLHLREQMEHRGKSDLLKLGYINPIFDMQMFDMGSRGPETPTGGDFALIVTTDFGGGPSCRFIVVQMKPAEHLRASIYRNDNARQFSNLGRHGPASFYGFLQQQDPMKGLVARPSVTFRPYSSILKEINARLLESQSAQETGELASSAWNIDTFTDALDLPSLFAFGLIAGDSPVGGSAENELLALETIAGGLETARAMVNLVAVCSIGRRLDPGLMKAATKLHLKHRSMEHDPRIIGRRKKHVHYGNVGSRTHKFK